MRTRAGRAGLPVAVLLSLAAALALAGCGPRGTPLAVRAPGPPHPTAGPLVLETGGGRWFVESGTDRAILLTGSHTWNNFQDWGVTDPPPAFDYPAYLDFLASHGHDLIRMYVWEQAAWFPGSDAKVVISPMPYLRTGPGRALDGGLRFDLTRFNPAYFERLRDRVRAARDRGIYVSVMLFDGWSIELKGQKTGNPWRGHPFNAANNVNGIDGDLNGDGEGGEVHTLAVPAITALQKAYVAKVVETLAGLDNVLWEISNESASSPAADAWQYEMIRTVRTLEAARGEHHPIGMTASWPPDERGNRPLFTSPADWVAPRDDPEDPYKTDPPASTARARPVISDTDHLWGIGGKPDWVWKTFFRALDPLFMDPYQTAILHNLPAWADSGRAALAPPDPEWEPMRRAMGLARAVAARTDLAALRPLGALCSSGWCLAAPGKEYLAYAPVRRGRLRRLLEAVLGPALHQRLRLDLSGASGTYDVEWVDPARALVFPSRPVRGGRSVVLRAPFLGPAIAHLRRSGPAPESAASPVPEGSR